MAYHIQDIERERWRENSVTLLLSNSQQHIVDWIVIELQAWSGLSNLWNILKKTLMIQGGLICTAGVTSVALVLQNKPQNRFFC